MTTLSPLGVDGMFVRCFGDDDDDAPIFHSIRQIFVRPSVHHLLSVFRNKRQGEEPTTNGKQVALLSSTS